MQSNSPPVPQPTVIITNTSAMANSNASIHCTATLNQYPSYSDGTVAVTVELLNTMGTAVATRSDSIPSAIRTAYFTVPTVDVSEAGQYQCMQSYCLLHRNQRSVRGGTFDNRIP